MQFYESWRARLRSKRYADGPVAGQAICQSRCEGAAPNLCRGLSAVRNDDYAQHSSHYSVCDNGATVFLAEGFRWILDSTDFTSSDPRTAHCARRVRRTPSDFGLVAVPETHLRNMVLTALQPMVTPSGKEYAPRRLAIIYNQFAHIHQFTEVVSACYVKEGGLEEFCCTKKRPTTRFKGRYNRESTPKHYSI